MKESVGICHVQGPIQVEIISFECFSFQHLAQTSRKNNITRGHSEATV